MVDLLGHAGHLQEVENMVMAMPWKPHVAAWMLAEFMVMWRWQNVLPDEFLRNLTMLLIMGCFQTCMLLLATGICVRMLNVRERKKVG
jgi:hypothetical protein